MAGPFAGAFFNYERAYIGNHSPYIVIVLKGTSPDMFAEWVVDAECRLESCAGDLGAGMAHEGFYKALFPSSTAAIAGKVHP